MVPNLGGRVLAELLVGDVLERDPNSLRIKPSSPVVAQLVVVAVGARRVVSIPIERELYQAVTLVELGDDVLGEAVLPVGLLFGAEVAPVGGTLKRIDLLEEIRGEELRKGGHSGWRDVVGIKPKKDQF